MYILNANRIVWGPSENMRRRLLTVCHATCALSRFVGWQHGCAISVGQVSLVRSCEGAVAQPGASGAAMA